MPSYRASFGKGFAVGAGAAVAYAAAYYYRRSRAPGQLIDWDRAAKVAIRTCGNGTSLSDKERVHLQAEYEQMVQGVEGPISQYTGTTLPLGHTAIQVMDRADWINANIGNFRELFKPVDELYAENQSDSLLGMPALADLGSLMFSLQVGLLIGYLARKVLGQYDISLLGKEPLSPGKLYFVEPNIRALEAALQVPLRELRLWIALHEATHAHEFEVHPWVRGYLDDHLQHYLKAVLDDLRGGSSVGMLQGFVSRLMSNLREGQNLIEALMTPEQRTVLGELQALMSLAEGYSNHVMNNIGSRLLPHFKEIHQRVEQRQSQRGQAEELFLRLTGLKMKIEQYRLGESFATMVTEQRGMAFLNRAWESPEHLPTLDEIRAAERWIARQEAATA